MKKMFHERRKCLGNFLFINNPGKSLKIKLFVCLANEDFNASSHFFHSKSEKSVKLSVEIFWKKRFLANS